MSGQRLRVLHLDSAGGWRGGQRQVMLLLGEQTGRQADRLEPLLACPTDGVLAGRVREGGLEPLDFAPRNALDGRALRRLLTHLEHLSPHLVHCHDSRSHGLALRAVKRLGSARPRLLVTRRVALRPSRGLLSRLKYTSALVDLYVGVSEYVTGVMRGMGVGEERLATVYSALEPGSPVDRGQARRLLSGEFGIGPEELVVGCVGAFTAEKGQHFLVRAAVALLARHPATRFLFLGDGPRLEEARRLAAGAAVPGRILLPGWRRDAEELLPGLDILCSPALSEGIGTTNLEALHHGIPVVASRVGGIPEAVLHEKTGLLVEPGDPEALDEALSRLLDDAGLRRRLGEAGRRLAEERFGVRRMADGYLEHYTRLCGSLLGPAVS